MLSRLSPFLFPAIPFPRTKFDPNVIQLRPLSLLLLSTANRTVPRSLLTVEFGNEKVKVVV